MAALRPLVRLSELFIFWPSAKVRNKPPTPTPTPRNCCYYFCVIYLQLRHWLTVQLADGVNTVNRFAHQQHDSNKNGVTLNRKQSLFSLRSSVLEFSRDSHFRFFVSGRRKEVLLTRWFLLMFMSWAKEQTFRTGLRRRESLSLMPSATVVKSWREASEGLLANGWKTFNQTNIRWWSMSFNAYKSYCRSITQLLGVTNLKYPWTQILRITS